MGVLGLRAAGRIMQEEIQPTIKVPIEFEEAKNDQTDLPAAVTPNELRAMREAADSDLSSPLLPILEKEFNGYQPVVKTVSDWNLGHLRDSQISQLITQLKKHGWEAELLPSEGDEITYGTQLKISGSNERIAHMLKKRVREPINIINVVIREKIGKQRHDTIFISFDDVDVASEDSYAQKFLERYFTQEADDPQKKLVAKIETDASNTTSMDVRHGLRITLGNAEYQANTSDF